MCWKKYNKMRPIKQKIRHRTEDPSETDLCEKIDKDVQSMLFPLNLMQILVLNPKYRMKNYIISPNNCFNKFMIYFGMVAYVSGYVYRVQEISLDPNFRRYVTITFLYSASYFDFIFYTTGFILNCIYHITGSKKMVMFVLTYQEVHRFIKNENCFKWSVIRSWIHVALIWSFYIGTFLFMCLAPWHIVFNLLVVACLDSNLIYVIVLIALLRDKVKLWNLEVKNLSNNVNDGHNKKMFEVYVDMLKCYEIVKNVFEQPVSLMLGFVLKKPLIYFVMENKQLYIFHSFWVYRLLIAYDIESAQYFVRK